MDSQRMSARLCVITVLVLAVGTSSVAAQTVCNGPPYLGSGGPELCINVYEDSGISLDFRGPSPITINQTVGDYRVNLTVSYAAVATGMGVSMEGTVRRTSAGTGGISVRADGGTNVSVAASSGSLVLIGDATGPSRVQLGGGAGSRTPGGDVELFGFGVTCDESVLAGLFECTHDSIPISPGAVAATNITGFHVTNVGDVIDIPSTTVAGLIDDLPQSTRRWRDFLITPGQTQLENRIAALEDGPYPDVLLFNLWSSGINMNHFSAKRFGPPYDGTGATSWDDIDVGPLFGIHRICTPAENRAVVPYIKWNAGNYDVWFAEYDGISWDITPVAATSSQDFHTVTCFETTHGLFFKTFNFTTSTIAIFRRDIGGQFQPFASFGSAHFDGRTPGSPFFGAAIGKAASFGSFGQNLLDSAGITVGFTDGTVAFGRLTTTTPPTLATINLGPADGETSLNLAFMPRMNFTYELQNQGVIRGGSGPFFGNPLTTQTVELGTISTGTLIPEFQGLAGATGPDGNHYVLADRGLWYDPRELPNPVVPEFPDYPYLAVGGPVDLIFLEDTKIGLAPGAGLGGQMLGILDIVEVFSDGFETGDTAAWTTQVGGP